MANDCEASLVITLRSAGARGTLMLEVPGGVALRKLLPHLLTVAGLSAVGDDGLATEYETVHLGGCRVLSQSKSLLSNGVVTGDELLLVARPTGSERGPDSEGDSEWRAVAAREETGLKRQGGEECVQLSRMREDSPRSQGPGALDRAWSGQPPVEIDGQAEPRGRQQSRVIALWSGPIGGTGCTVLALGLAVSAREMGCRTALLGLGGLGLSVYLGLPRGGTVPGEIGPGLTSTMGTRVTWQAGGDSFDMSVLAAGTDWRPGALDPGQATMFLSAARASHDLVVVDLPPLGPASPAGALELLRQAADVVLVVPPSALGVAATVEGLACLPVPPFPGRPTPRVVLVLNQRSPTGLSRPEFSNAVARLWGSCPQIAAEVDFSLDMARVLDRGDILGSRILSKPMELVAEALLGSPDQVPRPGPSRR